MRKKGTTHRPFRDVRRPDVQEKPAPESFSESMARAGTLPLPDPRKRVPRAPTKSSALVQHTAPRFLVSESDGFIDAAREGLSRAQQRLLRGTPTATLDLHGHDRASAESELRRFLRTTRTRGHTLVLIIVGKGRHSPGGHAVLRGALGEWLTTAPLATHVLAFRTAPPALGGTGGIVTLLARSDTQSR
jgi:DNA-nicking Smr family endonuclease